MKCDTAVETPGGLTLGCSLEIPDGQDKHDGDCTYIANYKKFNGIVLLCPVCSTATDPLEGDTVATRECDTCETVFIFGTDATEDLDDAEFDDDFPGAILLCPKCQTAVDAKGWGLATNICPDCKEPFSLNLDPQKVLEYSMY